MKLNEIKKLTEHVAYDKSAVDTVHRRKEEMKQQYQWEAYESNDADFKGKPIKELTKEEAIEYAKYLAAERVKWLEDDGIDGETISVVRYKPTMWKIEYPKQYGRWYYTARPSKNEN